MISKRDFNCSKCGEKFTAIRMRNDWANPPKTCSQCQFNGTFKKKEVSHRLRKIDKKVEEK